MGDIDYDAPVGPALAVYFCGRVGCVSELVENKSGMSCECCGAVYDLPDGAGRARYLGEGE